MRSVGETVAGRYALEREIGHGSMGRIFVALDKQLHRRVAIKCMHAELLVEDRARARFEHEARAIAQLRNDNVVQIHDFGFEDKTPFLVMELLEGETLDERLDRSGRLSLAAAAEIAGQIAAALASAHANGIVHRDLKPANIFLSRTERGEKVKLLDFGVAAIVPGWVNDTLERIQKGEIAGTPQFMSPEQIQGLEVDGRSDLWSLAVILYRMITGSWPFAGRNFSELVCQIRDAEPARMSPTSPELGPLDEFFARALAKPSGLRFQSATELAGALRSVADGASTRTARILVIDDEPDMELLVRQRFRRQISERRYDFLFATDGEAGLNQLRAHPEVDVVLTDIRMPGMDGLTFLAKAGEVNPLVKVIIVSAYGGNDLGNIRVAMNRGAFDFLMKPIDFKDLERTLDKCLKQVGDLRRALRSTEENDILRLFVANGLADRLVAAIRASGGMASEVLEGSVAFMGMHGLSQQLAPLPPRDAFQRINHELDLVIPEVTQRGGIIHKFIESTTVALFTGPDHGGRAVAAAVAVRDKLEATARMTTAGPHKSAGVSIGIDAGMLLSGCVGSVAIGRFEHAVLGEAVHTAAQLHTLAGPHEVLVSDAVMRGLAGRFASESLGLRPVAGGRPEISVHRVLASAPAAAKNLPREDRAAYADVSTEHAH